jgi:hypothetical protein
MSVKKTSLRPSFVLFSDSLDVTKQRENCKTSSDTVSLKSAISGHAKYDVLRGITSIRNDDLLDINDVIRVRKQYLNSLMNGSDMTIKPVTISQKQASPVEKKEMSKKIVNMMLDLSENNVKKSEERLAKLKVTVV